MSYEIYKRSEVEREYWELWIDGDVLERYYDKVIAEEEYWHAVFGNDYGSKRISLVHKVELCLTLMSNKEEFE